MEKHNLTNLFSIFYKSTRSVSVSFLWMILLVLPCFVNAQKANELQLLSSVFGKLQPFVSISKDNTLQNRAKFNITGGIGNVSLDNNVWQCSVNYKEVEDNNNSTDVDVVIRPSTETNIEAVMGVEFDFTNWSEKNYVMVPASVYNGNRFKTVNMYWPTIVVDEADRYHDIDPIIPEYLPHLNINEGPSKLNIKLNDASTPAVAFFSPEQKKSFLLIVKPTRNFDIAVEESADRKKASFTFSSTNKPDVISNKENEFFSISFRIFMFPSEYPIDLLTNFFRVRKSFTDRNEFVKTIPFGKIYDLQETLHNTERWDDSMKYYRQGGLNELDQFYSGVQLGWIGGLIEEQPLLAAGSELSCRRSVQSIETILNNMQGESGLMYGIFKDGVLYSDDLRNRPKEPLLGMARKNGDALNFLLQNLMMLKNSEKYKPITEKFEPKAQKLADGLVNLWKEYNQFGQFFDVKTGKLVVYGSTSGASIIGALALASEYFEEKEYLDVAEAAAAYFSTWVTSYDFRFPLQSVLGKIGAKATGSVWANIQNRHGAPAICNFSGDCLLKLYRATNNTLYLELLKDIAHNSVQYVSTAERPLTLTMHPGYVCERVNISSWEGKRNVGGNFYGSSPWVEVALMQTATQVPGIYVDVNKSTVTVFDHLVAKIINDNKSKGISIRVKNPTEYNTTCTVFLDFNKDKPMGWNNYFEYEKVELSANEEKVVSFNRK